MYSSIFVTRRGSGTNWVLTMNYAEELSYLQELRSIILYLCVCVFVFTFWMHCIVKCAHEWKIMHTDCLCI